MSKTHSAPPNWLYGAPPRKAKTRLQRLAEACRYQWRRVRALWAPDFWIVTWWGCDHPCPEADMESFRVFAGDRDTAHRYACDRIHNWRKSYPVKFRIEKPTFRQRVEHF